jgi:esterase/lipase superfamily enzyme
VHRSHIMLPDPHLGRNVHLWSYGHFGPPIVVFPSAAGFAHEWDAQGMIEALSPLILAGKMKLYCPESNVSASWTRKDGSITERMQDHQRYERFVLDTLVPHIRRDCGGWGGPMGTAGCSLGAMYSALFALKFPETFSRALCMSGRYLATAFTDGDLSGGVYFNSPLHFVPGLHGAALERVRQQTHLTLVCGQGKWEEGCIEETIALAELFDKKEIPHTRDIWGHDVTHGWEWWQRQARMHLGHWLR